MEQEWEQVKCWESVWELLRLHILGESVFVGLLSASQIQLSEKMLFYSSQQSKFWVSSKQTFEFDLSYNDSEHV